MGKVPAQKRLLRSAREVAIPADLQDGDEFSIAPAQLIDYGQRHFSAKFTVQESADRPVTKGTGARISDPTSPLVFPRNFDRVSSPDANACSGCPNAPVAGGGGDNVRQVTVTLNPTTVPPGGQATVTVKVQPVASGTSGNLSIGGSLDTGGHQHSSRPTGTASSYSGTTDSNGQWSTQYTASAFGGADTIAASSGVAQDQNNSFR